MSKIDGVEFFLFPPEELKLLTKCAQWASSRHIERTWLEVLVPLRDGEKKLRNCRILVGFRFSDNHTSQIQAPNNKKMASPLSVVDYDPPPSGRPTHHSGMCSSALSPPLCCSTRSCAGDHKVSRLAKERVWMRPRWQICILILPFSLSLALRSG